MTFEISNLRKVLSKLKDVDESIIYTEHYLEKIGHRKIDEEMVWNKLRDSMPDKIAKLPYGSQRYKVSFVCGDDELIVFLKLFLPKSIILISAYFKNGGV